MRFFILGLVLLCSTTVQAEPILLGQLFFQNSAGTSREVAIASVESLITYANPGSPEPYHEVFAPCVGCGTTLLNAGNVFNFTPLNTVGFNDFTTRLTDGIDQRIAPWSFALSASNSVLLGSASPAFESVIFGTETDLVGRRIESIALEVRSLDTTVRPGSSQNASLNVSGVWRFFGTGDPTPSATRTVPVPAMLWPTALMLIGLFVVRQRLVA